MNKFLLTLLLLLTFVVNTAYAKDKIKVCMRNDLPFAVLRVCLKSELNGDKCNTEGITDGLDSVTHTIPKGTDLYFTYVLNEKASARRLNESGVYKLYQKKDLIHVGFKRVPGETCK